MEANFKDDIITGGGLRKYRMINNDDGTVSFKDVTDYDIVGTEITAETFNEIATQLNSNMLTKTAKTYRNVTINPYSGNMYYTVLDTYENLNINREDIFSVSVGGWGTCSYPISVFVGADGIAIMSTGSQTVGRVEVIIVHK